MRDEDVIYLEAGLWLILWLVLSPVIMLSQNAVLTNPAYDFPCPWLVLMSTNLMASLLLFVYNFIRPPKVPEVLIEQTSASVKRFRLRLAVAGLLQGAEVGLGGVVLTGVSGAMWNEGQMLLPAIALGAAAYLRTELIHKELVPCTVLVVIGGFLAVSGNLDVSDWEMIPLGLVVCGVFVAKWMFTQAWLTAMDPTSPPPVVLAQRMLLIAGVLGIEATWFFEASCFGKVIGLKRPLKVFTTLLCISVGLAFWLVAELRVLQLCSTTLLGFMHPFRCIVYLVFGLFSGDPGSILNWIGIVIIVVAGIGYGLERIRESRSDKVSHDAPESHHAALSTFLMTNKQNYTSTAEVSRTIIMHGDGQTFPKRGDRVLMKYVGYLAESGVAFDMGAEAFHVGGREVIEGWDIGVLQMSLGERAVLHIPAAYGFGRMGRAQIPPNSDLVFHVQMLAINEQMSNCSKCYQM
eukprot:TRINITY_DN69076_c0_g1_i1.p1 TRINITY_DN69076_c0_g1~~TRINITY_DN69076_c0_g1_i1.p1  ORF type:complete len:463 (+),score=59.70 TRINITY_DN69076_c0_g1_i1:90-1478(+)